MSATPQVPEGQGAHASCPVDVLFIACLERHNGGFELSK